MGPMSPLKGPFLPEQGSEKPSEPVGREGFDFCLVEVGPDSNMAPWNHTDGYSARFTDRKVLFPPTRRLDSCKY